MSEQHKDPNAAYNAKVREIAEILASSFWGSRDRLTAIPTFYKSKTMVRELKEVVINEHMEQARAMVSEMAKEYEFAYFSNYHGEEESNDYMLWNQNCIYEMKERGLIPHTENNNNG